MFAKLGYSQTTIATQDKFNSHALNVCKNGTSAIRNPFKEVLPIKFPKNKIRKPTEMHMLAQTDFNPEKYCVRTYQQANKSHMDDEQKYKSIQSPGIYHNLSQQSKDFPIRLRTYEDLGVTNNEKRQFAKMSYKVDPIIVGEKLLQHNSSYENVWKQPRRHRDNGVQCEKSLNWNSFLKNRDPYRKKAVKEENTKMNKTGYVSTVLK